MFNVNSPEANTVRNIILAGLGASSIEPRNCKSGPTASTLDIKKVIFNNPATVIYWSDNTRTVVKCQPDDYFNHELGFLLAICKKVFGNTGRYNELLREYVPGYGGKKVRTEPEPDVGQMRKELADFCHKRSCMGCPMNMNGFECGRGKSFTSHGDGYMTDESIVKHYKAMKGEKEG